MTPLLHSRIRSSALLIAACIAATTATAAPPEHLSGIYPRLAFFNDEAECGTGAVVTWAGSLWAITYAPHSPMGSTDKLYEITPELELIVRPESIGGTPANRMIHLESRQLFIGPYAIDDQGRVRVIPYETMPGRPTGAARHLTDPANKIYVATMEEGFYEVDVHSLAVTTLYPDAHFGPDGKWSNRLQSGGDLLPGHHGKGLYSGQGRLIYANNGERSDAARTHPETPSGSLSEWNGADWTVIRRNQFTEVTGPGGIHGNRDPDKDPIWSIGWDHRSLILMLLDQGTWHSYRLPKASHSYDGAHGWNTEWPRIRDVGEPALLMTMHGMFWSFPKTFTAANSAGISPRSTYLKVIGDFCRWNDRIAFGCDDTARNEFLNTRMAKGDIAPPQSQSNLWFVPPDRLDHLGPVIGRGAVWIEEDIPAQNPSDPFLFSGFDRRGLHLAHEGNDPVTIAIDVDARGDGNWTPLRQVRLPARGYKWIALKGVGSWIRLRSDAPLQKVTAWFEYSNRDTRTRESDPLFDGLARATDTAVTGGIVRARDQNKRDLHFAALEPGLNGPKDLGYYELDAELNLRRIDNPEAHRFLKERAAIPAGVLTADDASVIFVNDDGRRWRLPRGDPGFDREGPLGPKRIDREVATERDLFNAHGTFYELPAENAGGFARVRPVATHNRRIIDFCSYRGLLVMSGLNAAAPENNPHVIRSDDGKTALWAGALDDIWKMGKPVGTGGPWKNSAVAEGVPSDSYLMTGYDAKTVTLSHDARNIVRMTVEIDLTGTGIWKQYRIFAVESGQSTQHRFPDGFSAYWVRLVADADCTATAIFRYE